MHFTICRLSRAPFFFALSQPHNQAIHQTPTAHSLSTMWIANKITNNPSPWLNTALLLLCSAPHILIPFSSVLKIHGALFSIDINLNLLLLFLFDLFGRGSNDLFCLKYWDMWICCVYYCESRLLCTRHGSFFFKGGSFCLLQVPSSEEGVWAWCLAPELLSEPLRER